MAPYVFHMQHSHGVLREWIDPPNSPKSSPERFPKAMSVLNGRIGITNRQLGSERLIPLIAGVRKGLPARLLLTILVNLK
jgi:hypothetical protein